ncbi:hypothetical protein ACFX13_035407 [Malus domestica]
MQGSGDDSSTFGLIINDLQYLLLEWSESMISHIQRERNLAAHRLARIGINSAQEVVWFKEPPNLIQDILLEERL